MKKTDRGAKPDNISTSPTTDGANEFERQNAGGGMPRGRSQGPDLAPIPGRQAANPNYNMALFAVMGTYKPKAGEFCQHADCQRLRDAGLDEMGIPVTSADELPGSKTSRMFGIMKALQPNQTREYVEDKTTGNKTRKEVREDTSFTQDLLNLASTREAAGHHNH